MALVRVYCGLASAYPPRQLAVGSSSLSATIVDDAGRVLDVCEIGDDSYGYAYLSTLLAERATGPYSVAIAAHGDRLVPALLTAAGWALTLVDEETTDDFADRFADDLPDNLDASAAPTQRRAVGLARALQAGALSASLLAPPAELAGLKPVLAAHSALATGRHAAAVALREVLRELYPAALRAYPDPADPVALAVMDALPDPSTLASSTTGRGRDAAAAADAVTARLAGTGIADQAAVTEAITALRVAIAETPRRAGVSRALTGTIAETVRQSVAAVRACDAASTVLVNALAERVSTPPAPASPAEDRPRRSAHRETRLTDSVRFGSAQASAQAPAAARPPERAAPAAPAASDSSAVPTPSPAPAPPPAAPPPTGPPPVAPQAPPASPPPPAAPAPAQAPQPTAPPRRQPAGSQPVPAPAAAAPPAGHAHAPAPSSPGALPPRLRPSAPDGYPGGPPGSPPRSAPPAGVPAGTRPVSPPPPPPPGITPIGQPRSPAPTGWAANDPGNQVVQVPVPRPAPGHTPRGSRSDWPTSPPADDWAQQPARAAQEDQPHPGRGTTHRSNSAAVPPPWRSDDLKPPPEPPALRLVEPTLPEELRADLGYSSTRPDPPPLRLVQNGGNGVPRSAPPVMADDDDNLLIFAQTRSAWFDQDPTKPWESEMDAGWRAAEQAAEPTVGERTGAGLPRRVPHANLVPGAPPRRDDRPLRVVRDPASIAAHTTGYFSGWRRGQEVGGYPLGGRPGRQAAGAWEFHRDEDRLSG